MTVSPGPHPAALYVHVPFCLSKCAYCDFYSLPSRDAALLDAYPSRLLSELDCLVRDYRGGSFAVGGEGGWDGKFDSLYIGGGTPTILPPPTMARLLSGLRPFFRGPGEGGGEWTVECNPESLSRERLDLLGEYGVNRLSLGVQSLEEGALKAAGRPASLRETLAAIDLLSTQWKGEWSADLIAGLPGQSAEGLVRDVRSLASSGVGHLSLYALTIEEGTPFADRTRWRRGGERGSAIQSLPSEEEAEDMWFQAAQALRDSAYLRYEVSNFCLPGKQCRHNEHYWAIDPYLGLGPGAVSTLLLPGGRSLRRTVGPEAETYCRQGWDGGGGVLVSYEKLEAKDSLKDYLLMSLRTLRGASEAILRGRFGLGAAEICEKTLSAGAELPGLAVDGEGMRLGDSGLDGLNGILVRLFEAVDGLVGE